MFGTGQMLARHDDAWVGHLMKVWKRSRNIKEKKACTNPFQYLLEIIAKIPLMR